MEMQNTTDRKVRKTGFGQFWWNCPGLLRGNSLCTACWGRDRWSSVLSTSPFPLSRSASVCWLSLKKWPFSFHHGSILESPGFGVMVLDIQSQTCIFCVLKADWQFPLPKPAVFPLCFSLLQWWGMRNKCKMQPAAVQSVSPEHQPLMQGFHKASKNWLLLLRDVLGEVGRENPFLSQPGESKKPWALLYLC